MTLSTLLIVMASAGLRCVSQILGILNQFVGIERATPSWSSSRLWLLRVGYYKLTRPKQIAEDWVWLVDHTIQAGEMKCLSIVGVRLSSLKGQDRNKVLLHQDLEPITLEPVRQSNGDIVYKQLNEAVRKTGVPRQIIGDHGSDLKAGIEKFIKAYPKTAYIYDIKHFTADVLEKELKHDLMWVEFTKWAAETRNCLHQTTLSYLEPPNQRSKSRYMNLDILVNWGVQILDYLDSLSERALEESESVLIEKLHWVFDFRSDIEEWRCILELVEKTEAFVRTKGLFPDCDKELRSILRFGPNSPERLVRIRWRLLEQVLNESLKAKAGECLLGSSEILESLFGKFKYLQDEHSKRSLTGFVLSIAAIVSKTTEDVVQRAMETVPVKVVRAWVKQKFGQSAASKRASAFAKRVAPEQKQDQIHALA